MRKRYQTHQILIDRSHFGLQHLDELSYIDGARRGQRAPLRARSVA